MSARTSIAAAAVILAAATFGLPSASAAPAIPLSGGQETQAADPDGHGFFTYTLEGTTFCWTLSWKNIETPTAAHVHVGARHVAFAGNIVIDLNADAVPGPDTSGCRTISTELAAAISAEPKNYYVNVHNATFPGGAIRGQLK
jgi:hypothetical protein